MSSCFSSSSFQLLPLVPVHNGVFHQLFELAQLCQHGRTLCFLRLSDLLAGVLGKGSGQGIRIAAFEKIRYLGGELLRSFFTA